MPKKKLNVAMIGYQFMGRAHSNAWRQVSRFFDCPVEPVMKVIVGRNGAAVADAADKLGWEESATDWEAVINRKDIDIIDICSPGDAHMPQAIAAANAKKIVLCEKPLANTLVEAEAVLAAAKKNKIIHMLCHNYRRVPAVTLAQQMIAAGELGDIYHYRGTYLQDWPISPDMPLYWRFDKKIAGSGSLGDIASHSIDLARYLVGEITEVSGLLKTFIKERPLPDNPAKKGKVTVDDAALSLVKFKNGAVGSIEGTRFAMGRKNYNRFEINGSKGTLVFNLERLNELEHYKDDGRDSGFKNIMVTDPGHPYGKAWWPAGHIIGYEHTFTHTVYDLLQAVQAGKVPTPNFEDGVRNQKVLDAVERSANSRSWEKSMKKDSPLPRRTFLTQATQTAAAALLAHQAVSAKEATPIRIGILLGTFRNGTLAERLDKVKANGLDCVQLSMDCAGLPALPDEIAPELAQQIRREAAERNITIASVSGTYNMCHPDAEQRQAGLRRLRVLAAACKPMGVTKIHLCSGTRDRTSMWRAHPDNETPEAWRDMLASMREAAAIARQYRVTLAFEPEVNNVVSSAQKARRLLDEIGSPHLKVTFDAANLFPKGQLPRMSAILDEAFALIGRDVVLAHAKDLDHDGDAGHLPAGHGKLDYERYVTLLHKQRFKGPLLLHGLTEAQVPSCVAFLREKMARLA